MSREADPHPREGKAQRAAARARRALLAGVLLTAAFVLSAPSAFALRAHVFSTSLGSPGSGAGQLALAAPTFSEGGEELTGGSGVAVNSITHDVYVADSGNRRIDEFDPSKGPSEQFVRAWGWGVSTGAEELQVCTVICRQGLSGSAPGEFQTPTFVAVDNSPAGKGDVYVGDTGNRLVSKFTAEGAIVTTWGNNGLGETPNGQLNGVTGEPFGSLIGIAVDGFGNLWVDGGRMFVFEQGGGFLGISWLAGGVPSGIAVDGSDNLYVANGFPDVKKFTFEGTELGSFFPGGTISSTGLALDSATGDLYLDGGSSIAVVRPGCPPPSEGCAIAESFGSSELSGGAGLAVDSQSSAVYAADTTNDKIDVFVLEPPAAPTVGSESVSKVTDESVSFSASIDPHGVSTDYRFEYGPCTTSSTCGTSPYEKSVPVPDALVGADFEVHNVGPVHVQGLLPHTTYHYRVIAHNTLGTTTGTDHSFLTQTTGGEPELPDNRQWELVSPPDKHGALIEPLKESGVIQASASGDAITYLATAATEDQPQGNATESQLLSTRGPSGWGTQDIAVPHDSASGTPRRAGQQYKFFSRDLSLSVVQPAGPFSASVSPEASEGTAYLRTDFSSGSETCPTAAQRAAGVSCYRPLVTGKPGFANVPEGNVFTNEAEGGNAVPVLAGATPDLSHILIESTYSLTTPGKAKALDPEAVDLYEWTAGKLTFLGEDTQLGVRSVSDDGLRVVFSHKNGLEAQLLLRDVSLGQTLRLDVPEPDCLMKVTCGEGAANPEFQGATGDGSKVFFTDTRRLTADAGTAETPDLYECDLVVEAGVLRCELHDLTPPGVTKEDAKVLGRVLGVSSDGSWVYFVANGDLAAGAASGADNLYVRHGGVTRLVGVLSNDDRSDWGPPTQHPAGVSGSGEWLVFMSDASLTGYDNRDVVSGRRDEEVFLYHASTGVLVCASCNPTGARPAGVEYKQIEASSLQAGLAGGNAVWDEGQWVAGNVPAWTPYEQGVAVYQSRYLSESGRLFFNSGDALVPRDVNHTEDVYEYEPPGVGGCTSASASFGVRSGGCVRLISSGTSPEESGFVDASESGGDVFFLSSARLSGLDVDTSVDLYDAHECTGVSPCLPAVARSLPCDSGDACKPAPSPQPPVFGVSGSATFSGLGNIGAQSAVVKAKSLTRAQRLARALKACRRKHARKRAVCERRARKHYGGHMKTIAKKQSKR